MVTIRSTSGGWSLTVNRPMVEVDTLGGYDTVADPAWRFTDTAGHEHTYHIPGPAVDDELPTLRHVQDESLWYDDGDDRWDEVEVWHWECRECGEVVVPGTKQVPSPRFIPGVTEATLTVGRSPGARTYYPTAQELADIQAALADTTRDTTTRPELWPGAPEAVIERFVASREAMVDV